MMTKPILTLGALIALLAGPAIADDKPRWDGHDRFRGDYYGYRYDHDRRGRWRNDHYWRHFPPASYRVDLGYRAGYEAGWHDAARRCDFGDRSGRWLRDPRGSWYFGLQFDD